MNPTTVFEFPLTIKMIPVGVAVLSALLTLFLLRFASSRRFAWIAGLVALTAGGMFAPAMWRDRVTVSEQQIQQTTGMPWAPTVKGFAMKGLRRVSIRFRRERGDKFDHQVWMAIYGDGHIEVVPVGDLWARNSEEISRILRGRGVLVS